MTQSDDDDGGKLPVKKETLKNENGTTSSVEHRSRPGAYI